MSGSAGSAPTAGAVPSAEAFDFYSNIISEIDTALLTYISDTATAVATSFGPVASQALVIIFIIYGIMIMRGAVEEPLTDFLMKAIKIGFVFGLSLGVARYNSVVASFIWNAPTALANIVTAGGGGAPAGGSFLDSMMETIYKLGNIYWVYDGWGVDLSAKLIAVLIWVAGMILTAYAAFLLILAKVGLAVMLGIGPLFILLTLFEATKKFFDAWLGQCFNYLFLMVLTAATSSIILSLITNYVLDGLEFAKASGQAPLMAIFPAIALCAVGVLVLMQIAPIASALGGGASLSTLGAAGALAGKAKNAATGKTLSDMRGQAKQKQTNANWAKKNPGLSRQVYNAMTKGKTGIQKA
jgi:type IV secretion system protein VirB6